jgi:hypothetical protein
LIRSNQLPVPSDGRIICGTLLTGVYDVNRNEQLLPDQPEMIEKWCASLQRLQLSGFIFHNSFSSDTIARFAREQLHFVEVSYDGRLNPNVYRYLIYDALLEQYGSGGAPAIKELFVTDISDVEVIQNPFEQPLFRDNPDRLFCGDEPTTLDNAWMRAHGTHLREQMPDFANFEAEYGQATLLNCGIIGGSVVVVRRLMAHLARIHRNYSISNQTPYTLDMGAFNYVARRVFGQHFVHGPPVNTQFKGYEQERMDCWFRHK